MSARRSEHVEQHRLDDAPRQHRYHLWKPQTAHRRALRESPSQDLRQRDFLDEIERGFTDLAQAVGDVERELQRFLRRRPDGELFVEHPAILGDRHAVVRDRDGLPGPLREPFRQQPVPRRRVGGGVELARVERLLARADVEARAMVEEPLVKEREKASPAAFAA